MSGDISLSDSNKFLKGLPKSGTMQNGVLFELVTSEHHTNEHDCSSLLNLPTPTASEHIWENCNPRKGVKGNHNLSLAHAVKLLPTPLANDAKISHVARNQMSLSKALLPTPTVMHVRNHDEPIEVFEARQARSSTGQIGQSTGVAVRLLATSTTNVSHTTGRCRNWGADLLHDVKCECKERRIHWI